MSTSREVFALRSAGSIDEAFSMAKQLVASNPNDQWNIKALAWCIFDLVKRSAEQSKFDLASAYVRQLEELQITNDDVLNKAIDKARILADPNKRIILQAREQSKLGNHKDALDLFRKAIQKFPNDVELNTHLGWELYNEGKLIFENSVVDIQRLRKLLAEYMKLKNPRPSRLHTQFLRFADKISNEPDFNFIAFVKLWNLDNLQEEDFAKFKTGTNTYPGIAEKIIQHSAKCILDKRLNAEVDYVLPYVDRAIEKCDENIWLTYYKAKLLHLVDRNSKAAEFVIPVVKAKLTEFWTWSLLGEILADTNIDVAISCYCRSLKCGAEEKFLGKLRLKFAELLIKKGLFEEAKCEIEYVIKMKETENSNIPRELEKYYNAKWYIEATSKVSNNDFYDSNDKLSQDYLFDSLHWLDACKGETFLLPEKPDKPRLKLYVKLPQETIEVSVSADKFRILEDLKPGDGFRIKGEYDNNRKFRIFIIERRDRVEKWDMFEWHEANLLEEFSKDGIVKGWKVSAVKESRIIESVIDLSDFGNNDNLSSGQPVFVKIHQYEKVTKSHSFFETSETRFRILSFKERPEGTKWDTLPEHIGLVDHVNIEKGILHFIVDENIHGTAKLDLFNTKVEPLAKLSLRLRKIQNKTDIYYKAVSCEFTEKEPEARLLRSFNGEIDIKSDFGFVDDVYVERSLIEEFNIDNLSKITGLAILSHNKKKRNCGWKAIRIDSVVPYETDDDGYSNFES